MSFPRDATLVANTVSTVDLTGDARLGDVLEIRASTAATIWARADGGTPAINGLSSYTNWWTTADPEGGQRLLLCMGSSDMTLRLLSQDATKVRIARVNPLTNLQKVYRGFGMGDSPEYPAVGPGVTAIVLSGNYRPGSFVRVDFPETANTYALTTDGSAPSLTNGATNAFGQSAHLVQLGQVLPEQSLKVFTDRTSGTVRLRVQKVLGAAAPLP